MTVVVRRGRASTVWCFTPALLLTSRPNLGMQSCHCAKQLVLSDSYKLISARVVGENCVPGFLKVETREKHKQDYNQTLFVRCCIVFLRHFVLVTGIQLV